MLKKLGIDPKYNKELEELRKERDKMYNGDIDTINKILSVYAKEIKDIYEQK